MDTPQIGKLNIIFALHSEKKAFYGTTTKVVDNC